MVEQACHMQNVIIVTLYDTYGPETVQYILNQAKIPTIVCSSDKIPILLNCIEELPYLKNIVYYEDIDSSKKLENSNITF
jgi:long-chain acyl-CoA synthetase